MFLVLAMCLTMLPTTAFAAEADVQPTVQADTQESEKDETVPAEADIQPNAEQTETQESMNDETSTGAEAEGANMTTEAAAPEVYDNSEKTEQTAETEAETVAKVASIGEVNYASLAEALAAASSGDEIVLFADNGDGSAQTVKSGVTVTINPKVTFTGALYVNGTLNVCGSIMNPKGGGEGAISVREGATVNIYDGAEVTAQLPAGGGETSARGMKLCGSATYTVNIYGGTITGCEYAMAIFDTFNEGSSINISGGTFRVTKEGAAAPNMGWEHVALGDGRCVYQTSGTEWSVQPGVAKNEETHVGYKSLIAALNAAKPGQTVELLQDTTENVSVPAGVTLKIPADFTLTGKVILDGTMELSGAVIQATGNTEGAVLVRNNGNLTINDGAKIEVQGGNGARGIKIDSTTASITINGGEIKAPGYALAVFNCAEVKVSGGTFISTGTTQSAMGWAKVKLSDGYLSNTVITGNSETRTVVRGIALNGIQGYGTLVAALNAAKPGETVELLQDTTENVSVPAGVTLKIPAGVTLTGKVILDGTMELSGAVIQAEGNTEGAVLVRNNGNLTINDGAKIEVQGGDGARGIKVASTDAVVTINGGEIKAPGYALAVFDCSKVTVNGGTFISTQTPNPAMGWAKVTLPSGYLSGVETIEGGVGSKRTLFEGCAKIGNQGYTSLVAALNAAKKISNATVELVKNTEEDVSVPNGVSLNIPADVTLNGKIIVDNGGTLNLYGAVSQVGGNSEGAVLVKGGSTFNMYEGAAVTSTVKDGESVARGIKIEDGTFPANVTILGGNIVGYDYALANFATNVNMSISGGRYEATNTKSNRAIWGWNDGYIKAPETGVEVAMLKNGRIWSVVEPFDLTLETSVAGAGFKVTVDNKEISETGNVWKILYSKSVTVSAGENAKGYWKDAAGRIVSDTSSYTFIMLENTALTWVPVTADKNVVTFKNDFKGVIAIYNSEELTAETMPTVPAKIGYIGKWVLSDGTDATVENIKSALESGSVTVTASYAIDESAGTDTVQYTVNAYNNVDNDIITKQCIGGTYIAVRVDKTKTTENNISKVFSHWANDPEGKMVVSYAPKYTFKVLKNVDLYAIYVDKPVEPKEPVLSFSGSSVTADETQSKYVYTASFTRFVPDEMEVVETGIQYSGNNSTWKKSVASGKDNNGAYTLNVRTSFNIKTVYFKGYVTVKDNLGNVSTYYSDIYSVNASDYVEIK